MANREKNDREPGRQRPGQGMEKGAGPSGSSSPGRDSHSSPGGSRDSSRGKESRSDREPEPGRRPAFPSNAPQGQHSPESELPEDEDEA